MKSFHSFGRLRVFGISLLLFPVCTLALDPAKSLHQYNCRTWTRQSGLPVNGIRDIAQSRDGYIWLGTQKGLVRFDGVDFTLFGAPDEARFRNRSVAILAPRAAGGLWFSVNIGPLGLFGSNEEFISFDDARSPFAQQNVTGLFESQDGWLWVGTSTSTARWKQSETNLNVFRQDITSVQKIYEDARKRIWLGTTEQGLRYWENGTFHTFPDTTLEQQTIFAIALDAQERLWIGTQWGLHVYDSNFQRVQSISMSTEVRALFVDPHDDVWIGTSGDGLARYQKSQITYLKQTNGLANDFVNAIVEDREGNLWIGTREGLSQLSEIKFPIISVSEGLTSTAAQAVASASDGGIWVAGNRGVSHIHENQVQNYSIEAGLAVAYVKRVFEASDGDVYLINGNREVEILAGGKVIARYPNRDWPTAIAEDGRGVVVAAGGGLFRASRTGYVPYEYPGDTQPPFYWVRNLAPGQNGSLLVATVNGLFRVCEDSIEHWTVEQGLPDRDVVWVSPEENGIIWMGFPSAIARLRGNEVRSIGRDQGLADQTVMTVLQDRTGSVWIRSTRGIVRLDAASVEAFMSGQVDTIETTLYDGMESIKTIDTTEMEYVGCKTVDGRICFPTPQGVAIIDPQKLPVNRIAPPVHIHHVTANGKPQMKGTPSRIDPGKGDLEFHYTALSYVAPQKVRFRYRLEGYDLDWVDAGNRRSAFYTNLKPKEYVFHVQACNADGVWNTDGASFKVSLPPYFFQTSLFYTCCAVGFVGILGAVYRWRVAYLGRKHKALQESRDLLETKVNERTRELAEQRNLLRTLIDHLPDNVFVKDAQSRIVLDNVAHAHNLGAKNPDEVAGKTDFDFFPREMANKFYEDEQALLRTGTVYNGEETSINQSTGQRRWSRTTKVPLRDSDGKVIGIAGINRDITERKQWETKLESLHRQLMDASRQAGMAEVATSVLHNVGNVLNSVNVSASIVNDRIKNSEASNLAKVVELLQKNENDLVGFLTRDQRGTKLLEYMSALVEHIDTEKKGLLQELNSLVRNIEHIKEIVAMQQSYARVSGVTEIVQPSDLAEDALRMHEAAYQRHGVKVVRAFETVPSISVDRHKVIQILVNLLQNAKYACDDGPSSERKVVFRIATPETGRVRFEVTDNGVGIPPENLSRIFSHGFTTRKNGHGFGLHSGALAAKEMHGSLTVHSDGVGKGATFTLELPVEYKVVSAATKDAPRQPRHPRQAVLA